MMGFRDSLGDSKIIMPAIVRANALLCGENKSKKRGATKAPLDRFRVREN